MAEDQRQTTTLTSTESTDPSSSFYCNICLDDVDVNREVAIVECPHPFCINCIRKWTQKSRQCPLCRCNIYNIMLNHELITLQPLYITLMLCNSNGWRYMVRLKRNKRYRDCVIRWYKYYFSEAFLSPSAPPSSVVLFFNGSEIKKLRTPRQLGMSDEDVVMIKHKLKLRMRILSSELDTDDYFTFPSVFAWDHLTLDVVL